MLGDSKYDGKSRLLNNPGELETDSVIIMEAALWFYMTPQSPKPSMHQVVTGQFVPSSGDTAAGISNGFGATINIINGAKECNKNGVESDKAASRIEFYDSFLEHFSINTKSEETADSKSCKSMGAFPTNSAGKVYAYFAKDADNTNQCKPVNWQT